MLLVLSMRLHTLWLVLYCLGLAQAVGQDHAQTVDGDDNTFHDSRSFKGDIYWAVRPETVDRLYQLPRSTALTPRMNEAQIATFRRAYARKAGYTRDQGGPTTQKILEFHKLRSRLAGRTLNLHAKPNPTELAALEDLCKSNGVLGGVKDKKRRKEARDLAKCGLAGFKASSPGTWEAARRLGDEDRKWALADSYYAHVRGNLIHNDPMHVAHYQHHPEDYLPYGKQSTETADKTLAQREKDEMEKKSPRSKVETRKTEGEPSKLQRDSRDPLRTTRKEAEYQANRPRRTEDRIRKGKDTLQQSTTDELRKAQKESGNRAELQAQAMQKGHLASPAADLSREWAGPSKSWESGLPTESEKNMEEEPYPDSAWLAHLSSHPPLRTTSSKSPDDQEDLPETRDLSHGKSSSPNEARMTPRTKPRPETPNTDPWNPDVPVGGHTPGSKPLLSRLSKSKLPETPRASAKVGLWWKSAKESEQPPTPSTPRHSKGEPGGPILGPRKSEQRASSPRASSRDASSSRLGFSPKEQWQQLLDAPVSPLKIPTFGQSSPIKIGKEGKTPRTSAVDIPSTQESPTLKTNPLPPLGKSPQRTRKTLRSTNESPPTPPISFGQGPRVRHDIEQSPWSKSVPNTTPQDQGQQKPTSLSLSGPSVEPRALQGSSRKKTQASTAKGNKQPFNDLDPSPQPLHGQAAQDDDWYLNSMEMSKARDALWDTMLPGLNDDARLWNPPRYPLGSGTSQADTERSGSSHGTLRMKPDEKSWTRSPYPVSLDLEGNPVSVDLGDHSVDPTTQHSSSLPSNMGQSSFRFRS